MARDPGGTRRRVLVPFEGGSFLRAPYGWTNGMRRDEGYPERGASRAIHIGPWRNLLLAIALYGPLVAGGVLGWRAWDSLPGAGLGVLIALGTEVVVCFAAFPVMAAVESRRSRRHR